MNAREFLLAVRHQADVATRGPWEASGNYIGTTWSGAQDWSGPIDDRELVAQASEGDAEFIAAARTNVPSLVAFALNVLNLADELSAREAVSEEQADAWGEVIDRIDAFATTHLHS